MKSIYKYPITNSNGGIIEGPITKLLTAQEQYGNIVVWAEIDTDKPNVKYRVMPVGTGWPLDPSDGKPCILDEYTYLSTVQLVTGALVFHVYYKQMVETKVEKNNDKTREGYAKANKPADKEKKENYTVIAAINPEILAHFLR
jgi:hypothetical protein